MNFLVTSTTANSFSNSDLLKIGIIAAIIVLAGIIYLATMNKGASLPAQNAIREESESRIGRRLVKEDILTVKFHPTKYREGYDQDEVDDFLDEIIEEFEIISTENAKLEAMKENPEANKILVSTESKMNPTDIVNKRFQTTKFREGYDQDEVDDFLDETVVELRELSEENRSLKKSLNIV